MQQVFVIAVWVGILAGLVSGAAIGLNFHRDNWLGGYGSWRRRLVRLGHVSFFGLAGLNLIFLLTVAVVHDGAIVVPGTLLLIGAATMPVVCFLSAWRQPMRRLFFIPVASLIGGVAWTTLVVILGVMGHPL